MYLCLAGDDQIMAKTKRAKISNFFFYLAMGIAVLSMVGFGLGGAVSSSLSSTVASVGDQEISSAEYDRGIRTELSNLSAQYGQNFSMEQAQLFGLDQNVLQRLISQAAMRGEIERLGISVSDDTVRDSILAQPFFVTASGEFDPNEYKLQLERAGYTVTEYESLTRLESSQNIVLSAIDAGIVMPTESTNALFEYIGESRTFSYTRLGETSIDAFIPAPTDEDLQTYYDANPEAFTNPLTRNITYVSLTPEMVAATLEVDADRIAQEYELRSDQYVLPARRYVERVVFGNLEDAQKAKADIDAKSMTFDDLIESRSLTLEDVDLGEVLFEDLEKSTAEALFATEETGVYGPLDSDLGPALFRVNAAITAQTTPLEAVTEELREALAYEDASYIILEELEKVADLVASGATLEEVADETKLELAQIDMFDGQTTGIAAYPAFRQEASTTDVGEERDVVETDDGGIFVLRVEGITEAFVKPFDEVKETAADLWRAEKLQAAIIARAETISNDINDDTGVSLEDYEGNLSIEVVTDAARTTNIPTLPAGTLGAVFGLEPGQSAVVEDVNGAMVVELNSVKPFDPEDPEVKEVLAEVGVERSEQLADDVLAYFSSSLVASGQPTVNQGLIENINRQIP